MRGETLAMLWIVNDCLDCYLIIIIIIFLHLIILYISGSTNPIHSKNNIYKIIFYPYFIITIIFIFLIFIYIDSQNPYVLRDPDNFGIANPALISKISRSQCPRDVKLTYIIKVQCCGDCTVPSSFFLFILRANLRDSLNTCRLLCLACWFSNFYETTRNLNIHAFKVSKRTRELNFARGSFKIFATRERRDESKFYPDRSWPDAPFRSIH